MNFAALLHWVSINLRDVLPVPLAQIALALVALVAGGIIGTERERREKPAGLRTLILVSLGSAGFTMVGFAFAGNNGDAGRVAAQIVTGIGFLCAGVILHPRGTISGTTTAASIWVTASVGMIAGAGYVSGALGLSLLVRFVLAVIAAHEGRMFEVSESVNAQLEYDPCDGRTRIRIERILADYPLSTITTQWSAGTAGTDRLTMSIHLPRHHLHELLDDLVDIRQVKKIRRDEA
jgi:putative Mg2+ transporter-C (MgtC) family protein